MNVDESSELRAEHEGLTYLFCSEKCRQRFLRDHREFAYDSSTDEQSGQGTAPKNEKKRQKVAIVVSSDSQILTTRQLRQASRLAGRCTPPLHCCGGLLFPQSARRMICRQKVFLRAPGFKLLSFSIPMRVDRGIDREETAVAAVS
jgi:YHS domain-containing protein